MEEETETQEGMLGDCLGKGKVSLDSDRSCFETLLERADPQDPESPQWLDHMASLAGRKGCTCFLTTEANTSESWEVTSLTTVGFTFSEFLFFN